MLRSLLLTYAYAVLANVPASISPATGDNSRPWLWAVIGGVAVVLVVLLALMGKRGGHEDDDETDDGDDK